MTNNPLHGSFGYIKDYMAPEVSSAFGSFSKGMMHDMHDSVCVGGGMAGAPYLLPFLASPFLPLFPNLAPLSTLAPLPVLPGGEPAHRR